MDLHLNKPTEVLKVGERYLQASKEFLEAGKPMDISPKVQAPGIPWWARGEAFFRRKKKRKSREINFRKEGKTDVNFPKNPGILK